MVDQGSPGGTMIEAVSVASSHGSSCSRTWLGVPQTASWSRTTWASAGTIPCRGLGRGFAAMIVLTSVAYPWLDTDVA